MPNAGYTLKVTGLRELIARGDAADRATKKLVREGLRDAVKPVQAEAARLFMTYDVKSATNYRIVVRKTGLVRVEQRLRKSANTRRRRNNFSGLQMRKALLPGFEITRPLVIQNLQKQLDVVGRLFVGD